MSRSAGRFDWAHEPATEPAEDVRETNEPPTNATMPLTSVLADAFGWGEQAA